MEILLASGRDGSSLDSVVAAETMFGEELSRIRSSSALARRLWRAAGQSCASPTGAAERNHRRGTPCARNLHRQPARLYLGGRRWPQASRRRSVQASCRPARFAKPGEDAHLRPRDIIPRYLRVVVSFQQLQPPAPHDQPRPIGGYYAPRFYAPDPTRGRWLPDCRGRLKSPPHPSRSVPGWGIGPRYCCGRIRLSSIGVSQLMMCWMPLGLVMSTIAAPCRRGLLG